MFFDLRGDPVSPHPLSHFPRTHERVVQSDVFRYRYRRKAHGRLLKTHGLTCCLTGGRACALWGTTGRIPTDIDMIVMATAGSQEQVKRTLVADDARYYIVSSTNPRNTYKVLWHRVRPSVPCKVDILVPPVLSIPTIDAARITFVRHIPVQPLFSLLLLKLQAWNDHRSSRSSNVSVKQHTDAQDIDALLVIAVANDVNVAKEAWLPGSVLTIARARIWDYARSFPSSVDQWKKLGYTSIGMGGFR
ncbi:hypothetical protein BV25DRAFT_1806216 [Artomyces pyxidatus]|uniref:Uncharacterized protein n=1 Tax=Artomyces pyxidatus TaxID=48021 RepID=A0ACB8SWW8_9AGAM|nr:hypothetical protein BV25DRAFT_1806216 [Artomyces pyxidatus]